MTFMHLEPSGLVCSICSWNGRCRLPSSSTEGTSTVAEVAPEMSISCWTINSLSAISALRQTTFSLNRFPLFYSILKCKFSISCYVSHFNCVQTFSDWPLHANISVKEVNTNIGGLHFYRQVWMHDCSQLTDHCAKQLWKLLL